MYKRQDCVWCLIRKDIREKIGKKPGDLIHVTVQEDTEEPVSYTHLRAHETVLDIVCRLLLEKKKRSRTQILICQQIH